VATLGGYPAAIASEWGTHNAVALKATIPWSGLARIEIGLLILGACRPLPLT